MGTLKRDAVTGKLLRRADGKLVDDCTTFPPPAYCPEDEESWNEGPLLELATSYTANWAANVRNEDGGSATDNETCDGDIYVGGGVACSITYSAVMSMTTLCCYATSEQDGASSCVDHNGAPVPDPDEVFQLGGAGLCFDSAQGMWRLVIGVHGFGPNIVLIAWNPTATTDPTAGVYSIYEFRSSLTGTLYAAGVFAGTECILLYSQESPDVDHKIQCGAPTVS